MKTDKDAAVCWAKGIVLNGQDVVVLDTETTGLDNSAEIVSVSVLAFDGTVLMDDLVKPKRPIPADATRIHHISNAMVEDAPDFAYVAMKLIEVLRGKIVVIYNAAYDTRLLIQCGLRLEEIGALDWQCAMMPFSAYIGDWNVKYGNYKWQPLTGGDHSSTGDCKATIDLIWKMSGMCRG